MSAQGFLNWCNENNNVTFTLVYQLIFNFTLAIYVQKVGIRANDWNMIDAARMKFLPFFYGFNHPIYQEVEYRDLYNRATYPDCISQFMQRNSCFNTSTLVLNHQGGDFCLENKIRRHKMVAPKGIVTNSTWHTISRGLDKIEKVQENAETILGINKSTRYTDTELYNECLVEQCCDLLGCFKDPRKVYWKIFLMSHYHLNSMTLQVIWLIKWKNIDQLQPQEYGNSKS